MFHRRCHRLSSDVERSVGKNPVRCLRLLDLATARPNLPVDVIEARREILPALSKSHPLERQWAGGARCPATQHEEITMNYMLLIYGNEAGMLAADKETAGQMIAAYTAYSEAMKKAGILVGANRLRPTASASTVRVADGKTKVLDGPYAETKEQLGGYYLIDVPDLDAALSWAARCPGANHGTIEVRPIWVM